MGVSSSISFCNNLKKRQIQTNEKKKTSHSTLFDTIYIFGEHMFPYRKKIIPSKKIISLCEIKTTEKKNNNSTYNLLVCYVHVNNPPIQNKKQKKMFGKKVLKKLICIIHTSNYCNLLRRNHDLRIFQKRIIILHTY